MSHYHYKSIHGGYSSVAVAPSLEGPGKNIPDPDTLCRLGFRTVIRSRNARAAAAAAASLALASSDAAEGAAATAAAVASIDDDDRCSLHRNEPGCVVGAHRQYLAAAGS
jgi:hypothetical protein